MDESNAAADLLPYGSAVRLMCPLPPAFPVHDMPDTWDVVKWGPTTQGMNKKRVASKSAIANSSGELSCCRKVYD